MNWYLVLDFGGNKTATNGDFVIQFPTAIHQTLLLELATRNIGVTVNGFLYLTTELNRLVQLLAQEQ